MSKCKRSHIILSFLAVLLFATPLVSSSSRPKYLYFVINILIIALGAEAGLISSLSKPLEDKKIAASNTEAIKQLPPAPSNEVKKVWVVEKSRSEKMVRVQADVDRVKKCPSMPSLFFIGGGGDQAHEVEALEDVAEDNKEEVEMEDFEDVGGKELFTKAEMFIGNFYKQLKMQREDSWKRIHGFYQKSF